MLKVTLLKVKHENEGDAKKLLDHIRKCDVFAVEHQAGRLTDAVSTEKQWIKDLELSRTQFLKKLEHMTRQRELDPSFVSFAQFEVKQMDYLFRQRKPIVYLERFSHEESDRINMLIKKGDHLMRIADVLLFSGSMDQAMAVAAEGAATMALEINTRDRHIAGNLQGIDTYIRNNNPALIGKEPISLTVCLGARHAPERYSVIPIEVKILDSDYLDIGLHEKPSDYSRRDLFAFVLSGLLRDAGIKVEVDQFRRASIGDLEGLLRLNHGIIAERLGDQMLAWALLQRDKPER